MDERKWYYLLWICIMARSDVLKLKNNLNDRFLFAFSIVTPLLKHFVLHPTSLSYLCLAWILTTFIKMSCFVFHRRK